MNRFSDKTALGIVTCNREDMLQELVKSIDVSNFRERLIINNGNPLKGKYLDYRIVNPIRIPTPVGHGKNKFFREARKKEDTEYFFLLEDDIRIKNNDVWQHYIDTINDSGIIGQLSYGMHGSNNKVTNVVEYSTKKVDFYQESYAAFTVFRKDVFKLVGYLDENFINAAEHLEHYHRLSMKGGTPFRYFPDAHQSYEYIEDQDSGHSRSVIRSNKDWQKQFEAAWKLFRKMYGVFPHELPKCDEQKLMSILTEMEIKYGRKELLNG